MLWRRLYLCMGCWWAFPFLSGAWWIVYGHLGGGVDTGWSSEWGWTFYLGTRLHWFHDERFTGVVFFFPFCSCRLHGRRTEFGLLVSRLFGRFTKVPFFPLLLLAAGWRTSTNDGSHDWMIYGWCVFVFIPCWLIGWVSVCFFPTTRHV